MNTNVQLLIIVAALSCFARSMQSEVESVITEIPAGFIVINESIGDINGDGRDDVVQVIEQQEKEFEGEVINEEVRRLRVFVGNVNGGYNLWYDNKHAIYGSDEGGMFDPFESTEIKRNSVFINFYGGSGWRWGVTYQFLFRNDQLILAGKESESFHAGAPKEVTRNSSNYLSGKALKTTITRSGDRYNTTEVWSRIENNKRITLDEFDIDNY